MHKDFCIHYRRPQEGLLIGFCTCLAGVEFEGFRSAIDGLLHLPCMGKTHADPCEICSSFQLPTKEQLDARQAELKARMIMIGTARKAITDHLNGAKSGSGRIKCPCCDCGSLGFSKAAYNGHIHAHCSTSGCVSWME